MPRAPARTSPGLSRRDVAGHLGPVRGEAAARRNSITREDTSLPRDLLPLGERV
jgi:hypothetical protein